MGAVGDGVGVLRGMARFLRMKVLPLWSTSGMVGVETLTRWPCGGLLWFGSGNPPFLGACWGREAGFGKEVGQRMVVSVVDFLKMGNAGFPRDSSNKVKRLNPVEHLQKSSK